jgi:hypothetical protein
VAERFTSFKQELPMHPLRCKGNGCYPGGGTHRRIRYSGRSSSSTAATTTCALRVVRRTWAPASRGTISTGVWRGIGGRGTLHTSVICGIGGPWHVTHKCDVRPREPWHATPCSTVVGLILYGRCRGASNPWPAMLFLPNGSGRKSNPEAKESSFAQ